MTKTNQNQQLFRELKETLNNHTGERTVKVWNELRAFAKKTYPLEVINMLDVSGFITKWLEV